MPLGRSRKTRGLKLNGTYQLLVYADDVNLLGDDIDTIKKNNETLIDTSKELGLEVNSEKTMYMLLSHHHNAGQNHDIKTANRCSENVAQFRCLEMAVTDQNWIQEEMKRRLNSGNACNHSVQNLLSPCLLCKNLEIRISKTLILLVVLYEREAWSLTLRQEHRLRVFGNRVLRRIFRPKLDEVIGSWRKLHNEELHNLNTSPSIIRMIRLRRMRSAGHVPQMGIKKNALVGNPEGKRPLGRSKRMWEDNIKLDLREIGWGGIDWIGLA
jgi:hypothetical protein